MQSICWQADSRPPTQSGNLPPHAAPQVRFVSSPVCDIFRHVWVCAHACKQLCLRDWNKSRVTSVQGCPNCEVVTDNADAWRRLWESHGSILGSVTSIFLCYPRCDDVNTCIMPSSRSWPPPFQFLPTYPLLYAVAVQVVSFEYRHYLVAPLTRFTHSFPMAYSKAKLKSNGNKASPCLWSCWM